MRPVMIIIGMFMLINLGFSQEWLTDYEEAKIMAGKEQHNIILVFQGSDWCAPCIKLEQQIWSSTTFQQYAKEHYVLLKADFPRKKKNQLSELQQKQNETLAEKYNQEGYFPLVVVLDPNGKILGKTGYENVSPEEYLHTLQTLEASL